MSGRTLGWGLVRPHSLAGESLPVVEFLDRFATGDDMARVDRICRSLHLANFGAPPPADGYLFLNLHPRHLLSTRRHGEVFSHIADVAGRAASASSWKFWSTKPQTKRNWRMR